MTHLDKGFSMNDRDPCPDIRYAGWRAWPTRSVDHPAAIHLGDRWELCGHPEWNHREVAHQLSFSVPESLIGRTIGLFCTAVDDEVDVIINGLLLTTEKYRWAYQITKPIIVDLTAHLRYGFATNELILVVRDHASGRGGGVVGNVHLFHGIPFALGPHGQILLPPGSTGRYEVIVHLGQACLSRNHQTTFTAAELATLAIPPGILRHEELALVVPEGTTDTSRLLKLDLMFVHAGRSRDSLSLSIGSIPQGVPQFSRISFDIDLQASYDNPDNPEDINLVCLVETPSNRVEEIHGFFAQDFSSHQVNDEEEILLPCEGRPWKLYYRPREAGVHSLTFFATDRTGTARRGIFFIRMRPLL